MANLTADRKTIRKDGTIFAHPMAASSLVYHGALVNLNGSGYAVPAADNSAHTFAGKADVRANNSAGADGEIIAQGHREGLFEFSATGMTQADVNSDAYVIDDNTVGLGIVAQPVNVTGVVVERTPVSRGGAYALAYVNATSTLTYGGGTGVVVSGGGVFTITAPDGSTITAAVTPASLPAGDANDTLTMRNVRVGVIAEVVSATSVYVDILGGVRK